MAADDDLLSLGPWPLGVDNRNVDGDINAGALRDALNWGLTLKGKLFRRGGVTPIDTGRWHSGFTFRGRSYAVKDGALGRVTRSGDTITHTPIVSGLGTAWVYCVGVGDDIYWSDGSANGVIRDDVNHPWSPPNATTPSLAAASGSLKAGNYLVSLTYLDALGREGGASEPVSITLADNQAITVTLPAAPAGASYVRIYRSATDGSELWLHATALAATSSATISVGEPNGALLENWPLRAVPPMINLCLANGSIYGSSGDRLIWTEPMRPHLTRAGNRHRANATITMLASIKAGFVMGTTEDARLLTGNTRGALDNAIILQHGVPAHRPRAHTDTSGVFWVSNEGVHYTNEQGGTRQLTQDRLAMNDDIVRAALGVDVVNGTKQLLTSMRASIRSRLGASDYYASEVIRANP